MESSYCNEILERIYYDPWQPQGFGSIDGLYRSAKAIDKKITKTCVRNWLHSQDVHTLHFPSRRHFRRRKTIVPGLYHQMQIDLVDLSSLSKQNSGFKFLLVAIDLFSRKAFVLPLKRKTGIEVRNALVEIFKNYPPVRYLQSDLGTEFYNKQVKEYLRKMRIKLFSTSSDTKSSLVERFNRTLKGRMFKYFTANNTVRYIHVLQDFVDSYNNRKHRSINIAPNEVTYKNEREIWSYQYSKHNTSPIRFNYSKGDIVRISKLARTFKKGYLPTFSSEQFIVHHRFATRPVTYSLKDMTGNVLIGSFYEAELVLVR